MRVAAEFDLLFPAAGDIDGEPVMRQAKIVPDLGWNATSSIGETRGSPFGVMSFNSGRRFGSAATINCAGNLLARPSVSSSFNS